MQKNKFTTYLFYAVGEILLVVIGILIAVRINNWNQDRKNNQREAYIITRLIEDLRFDKEEINSVGVITYDKIDLGLSLLNDFGLDYFPEIDAQIEYIDQERFIANYKDRVARKYSTNETIGEKLQMLVHFRNVDISNLTFVELQSNGQLELIKSRALREKISSYYAATNDLADILFFLTESSKIYQRALVRNGFPDASKSMDEVLANPNKDELVASVKHLINSMILVHAPYENYIVPKTDSLIASLIDYKSTL